MLASQVTRRTTTNDNDITSEPSPQFALSCPWEIVECDEFGYFPHEARRIKMIFDGPDELPIVRLVHDAAKILRDRVTPVREESEYDLFGVLNVLSVFRDLDFYRRGAERVVSVSYWGAVNGPYVEFQETMSKWLFRVSHCLFCGDNPADIASKDEQFELREAVEIFVKPDSHNQPTDGDDWNRYRRKVYDFALGKCSLLSGEKIPPEDEMKRRFGAAARMFEEAALELEVFARRMTVEFARTSRAASAMDAG